MFEDVPIRTGVNFSPLKNPTNPPAGDKAEVPGPDSGEAKDKNVIDVQNFRANLAAQQEEIVKKKGRGEAGTKG